MHRGNVLQGNGEMPERPKGHDWKSCVGLKASPWVQIPLSPPSKARCVNTLRPEKILYANLKNAINDRHVCNKST
jgi:hypothetical protein